MKKAIIAAGGWAHPGDDQIQAVQHLLKRHDMQANIAPSADAFGQALHESCDLLVVASCWFSMGDARYTEDQRAAHALTMTPALAESLRRVRAAGCPLLALHTAVICFDDLVDWSDWLGGTWNWQTSFHPPPEPITVSPSVQGPLAFEPFIVTDELYQGLDVDPTVAVVAESAAGHPLAWLRETPTGRAAVNVLGHDHRSLRHPQHMTLNQQLLGWLLG